jgi:hypothetical protein
MHRWKLINDALGLGQPEPEETYSTSDHLYAQLGIPREATGTLPRAQRDRAGLEAEAIEDIGETGRIRSPHPRSRSRRGNRRQSRSGQVRNNSAEAGTSQVAAEPAGTRRRRRTRAGREVGGEPSAATPLGSEPATKELGGKPPAKRLARRRTAAAQPENPAEVTRRKAS